MRFLLTCLVATPLLVACGDVRTEQPASRGDAGGTTRDAAERDTGTVPSDGAPRDAGIDRASVDAGVDSAPMDASVDSVQSVDSGAPSPCPSSAPAEGSVCAPADFVCDYGTEANPDCNTLFQCIDGAWQNMTQERTCPPPGATCPASFAAASGTRCDFDLESELCAYPQGTCVCGYPGQGNAPEQWTCTGAAGGCPLHLPMIGSSCPGSSASICNYGGCSGPATTCLGGFWSLYLAGCD